MQCEEEAYRSCLGTEAQQSSVLEALLCFLRRRLVVHSFLVYSAGNFIRLDTDQNSDVYLRAIFAAVCERTDRFCSATSNAVKNDSAMLQQDVSSILTLFPGCLAALPSELSVSTSSDLLGPGDASPLSYRSVKRSAHE